jgi:hypothetical protein
MRGVSPNSTPTLTREVLLNNDINKKVFASLLVGAQKSERPQEPPYNNCIYSTTLVIGDKGRGKRGK